MQIIIEADGILLNIRPAYWQAYQLAVREIGLACTDEGTFWRVIRRGDDLGLLLQGGKPRHVAAFEEKFAKQLASEAIAKKLALQEEAQAYCDDLRRLGTCHLVTLSAHSDVQTRLLRSLQHVDAMLPVKTITEAGINNDLNSLTGGQKPVVVLSAHERLLRAADKLSFIPVGIASGACIAKRLPRCGAIATYRNASAFCEARAEGDPPLVQAGIQPDRR
ncbi:MAG: hypothetical protein GXP29_13595 [Planctomycetes bacterium]|nr:hypothetical protein [Planctomycetota bacterium]